MYSRKIKIAHIITRLISGGADEHVISLVAGLDKSIFTCCLIAGGDSEILTRAESKGINIIKVKFLVRKINPLKDIYALIHILFILKKIKVDIVHTNTAKAGIIGRLAAKLAGVPIIVHTLHGLSYNEYMPKLKRVFYIYLERWVNKITDRIISVSEIIKNKSIRLGTADKQKMVTIYSGIDMRRFNNINTNIILIKKSLNIHPDYLIIGTVARLEQRKGLRYFVEIVNRLRSYQSKFKAVIVGEGPEYNNLLERASLLGLQDTLLFTGYRHDVLEIMSLFDILCLTSLWEGIPRILVEGGLLRKPLVAFDIDGNSEVIKEGVNGYLIPKLDIDAFVQALNKLYSDQNLRLRLSRGNKKIGFTQWDLSTMIEKTQVLYGELVQRKLNINLI
jgi:glycosyltransferase involved in cell wall biosynthesis